MATAESEFDTAAFKTNLATELTVDESTFTITAHGGSVIVNALFTVDLVATVPLEVDTITHFQTVHTTMNLNANDAKVTNGVSEDSVVTYTLNLCEHACQSVGTCAPSTGVCACVGNFWGIDCETPCTCAGGEPCVNAICSCTYPNYGLRCDSVKVCGCDED